MNNTAATPAQIAELRSRYVAATERANLALYGSPRYHDSCSTRSQILRQADKLGCKAEVLA